MTDSNGSARARVVILAGPGDTTHIVFHALAKDPAIDIARVVIEAPVPRKTFLERRLKKLGARVVAGQILFQGAVVPVLRRRARARIAEILARDGLDPSAIPEGEITRVPSANDASTIELLKSLAPAVVVVNGTRILSKALLTQVPARFVNVHAGITPLYRGVHGGYWALAEKDRARCGVTVHLVDAGIDTGSILSQAPITPTREDTFVTYPYLQIAAAIPLLREAVKALARGDVNQKSAPEGKSRLWSHPTIGQYLWNRAMRGVR